MEISLYQSSRLCTSYLLFGILTGQSLLFFQAVADENSYSRNIQEHLNCDHIITRFIEQVQHKTSICQEEGVFPKPGNCSVFFKCVKSDKAIQPFVEYCSVGYNFVGGVCLPSANSSDCPQYTCRIPDTGTIEGGNDIESNDDGTQARENESQQPPVSSALVETSFSSTSVEDTTMIILEKESAVSESTQTAGHSEQLMQATITSQESKGSVKVISHLLLILLSVQIII